MIRLDHVHPNYQLVKDVCFLLVVYGAVFLFILSWTKQVQNDSFFLLQSIFDSKCSEKNINHGFKFITGFGYECKRKSSSINQLCIKLGIQPTRPPYIACEHQLILNKIAENKIKIKVKLFFYLLKTYSKWCLRNTSCGVLSLVIQG